MPNIEHFAHVFAIMCHINVAATGLLLFFYEDIHLFLKNSTIEIKGKMTLIQVAKDEEFTKKVNDKAQQLEYFMVAKLAIQKAFNTRVYDTSIWFIDYSTTSLNQVKSKDEYLKKYLPFFLIVGVYCMVMLILAALWSEMNEHDKSGLQGIENAIHWTLMSIYVFAVSNLVFTYFLKFNPSILRTSVQIAISIIIPMIVFRVLGYEYFYQHCTNNISLFIVSLLLVTMLPVINIIRKYTVHNAAKGLVEWYYDEPAGQVTEKLDDSLNANK